MNSWSGSIEIGVTALDPNHLDFPSSATGLKGGSWIISGCSVLRNGRSILEEYGQDLDQLGEGDQVGIQRTANSELHLWVNGQDCGTAATGIPARVWAVVDLYGKCTQITVVPSHPEEAEEGEAHDEGNPEKGDKPSLHLSLFFFLQPPPHLLRFLPGCALGGDFASCHGHLTP